MADNRKDIEYDLTFEVHYLLHSEPFYSSISRNMSKVPDYTMPTAGVRFSDEKLAYELRYNPKFMVQLKREHAKAVLMHEFDHCILGHITERLPVDVSIFSENGNISQEDRQKLKRWNISTDLAINSLPNMKEAFKDMRFEDPIPDKDGRHRICGVLMPGPDAARYCPEDPNNTEEEKAERLKAIAMYEKLPEGQSAEWYMKNIPEALGQCHGDHSEWGVSGLGEKDKSIRDAINRIARQKMKDMIQKSFDEANRSQIENGEGWGSVSERMRQEIADLIKPKLDPQQVLRYFIKTSVNSDERNSITKINRKWAYIHPGRRYDEVANVAISIDESGSVSDDMMKKFFGWLNSLSKFVTFTVIPFDHEVFEEKVYIWEKGTHKPMRRELCGGTNFDAPTAYVNERNFDAHIILTDMCAPQPGRSKCKRMWITTESCARRTYFETNERILIVD